MAQEILSRGEVLISSNRGLESVAEKFKSLGTSPANAAA